MRIGTGYDVHALTEGRPLVIGGVTIPYELGLAGHSDADVLLHAVMDALLGAAALGDIGAHFPDTDERYKGISSLKLLEEVRDLLAQEGYVVDNIDATIIAQRPKMRPYIEQMRQKIADTLEIEVSQVNVKATTEEGLGFTGRGEGISSQAVCLLSSAGDLIEGSRTVFDSEGEMIQNVRPCATCGGCIARSGT
ncbi:MAG: 2-C-methyl-D-erythritol 2,4-cyclodiphosphate synthase [Lachnospiraceae bacterium]|nr:2-C-methyl-D-erythritol 2,4-cyclodiphosphate synthase [Lachnospiraceae bacterium]